MQFKVGDKVKILPSAVNGGVSEKDVGKIGEIIEYGNGYFDVMMDSGQSTGPNLDLPWAVYPNQMELVVTVGQQLVFDFMGE